VTPRVPPIVVLPEMFAVVAKSEVIVPTVVEARLKTAWLRTVRKEEEALERVVLPATLRVLERVRAVAEAVERVVCPVALSVEVKRLVEVRAVVDALVITEEEAKIFCEKRLRKRRAFEPSERVVSVVGRVSPAL